MNSLEKKILTQTMLPNTVISCTSIINVVGANNHLNFQKENFAQIMECFLSNHPILLIGAIGKMRVGKSSALNNFLQILTGENDEKKRPFSEDACAQTNTRGIHAFPISWETIIPKYQEIIGPRYNKPVNILLMDCEGTESSNSVATSRLYLINMLITSVIHIHVSKAIDQGFATKFSQATISSKELIKTINGEMLPGVHILIKDTTEKAWENAQKADGSLKTYEDLLQKYPDLYNYYTLFGEKSVQIIPPPKTMRMVPI